MNLFRMSQEVMGVGPLTADDFKVGDRVFVIWDGWGKVTNILYQTDKVAIRVKSEVTNDSADYLPSELFFSEIHIPRAAITPPERAGDITRCEYFTQEYLKDYLVEGKEGVFAYHLPDYRVLRMIDEYNLVFEALKKAVSK